MAWPRRHCMVGAKHSNSGAKLGASKRHHVLSNVRRHHLPVLRSGVIQNPLDQVVAVLVASNVNQRNSSPVPAPFTHTIQVATEEIRATDFKALFHNF